MINDVNNAAIEQNAGISQINQAVTQMDEMTQQNAALVEEGAAAADSLKDQAGRLTQMVGTFQLTRDGSAETSWGVPTPTAAQPVPAPALRSSPQAPLKRPSKLPSLPR